MTESGWIPERQLWSWKREKPLFESIYVEAPTIP
jgi:hypothetical protein